MVNREVLHSADVHGAHHEHAPRSRWGIPGNCDDHPIGSSNTDPSDYFDARATIGNIHQLAIVIVYMLYYIVFQLLQFLNYLFIYDMYVCIHGFVQNGGPSRMVMNSWMV